MSYYHHLLHPDVPAFLQPYLTCPSLLRLKQIGLFCGVDYSCLFQPKVFYSRFDHSLGVSLITWHFTHNRDATLAALLHDVSTPVFSHVIDFKNQDYLQQETTEKENAQMILADQVLIDCLKKDQIDIQAVLHDDCYPIANQQTPHLCADRLEYMFATGLYLTNSWDLTRIARCYQDLTIQKNESQIELGFCDEQAALDFFWSCLPVSQLFLDDKDKITLQLLATMVDRALEIQLIQPDDLYSLGEKEMITRFKQSTDQTLQLYLKLLHKQKTILLQPTPLAHAFCVKLEVKRRYIDPLCQGQRLSQSHPEVQKAIEALFQKDNHYICLPFSVD